MRLAGSISWPKDKEGRIIELTQVVLPKSASKAFYLDQIHASFPPIAHLHSLNPHVSTPSPEHKKDDKGFEVDGREDRMTRMIWGRVVDLRREAPIPLTSKAIEAEIQSLFEIYLSKVNTRLSTNLRKEEALEQEGRGISLFRHKFHLALKQWDDKVAEHAAQEPPKPETRPVEVNYDPETGEILEAPQKPSETLPEALTGWTGTTPPPRPWAYGDFLMRQAVTAVAAPPGVGKTTFSFQLGLAFAQDMVLGDWSPVVGGGGKVWLYNNEEPIDELHRRFLASCIEAGVDPELAARRFFYASGLNYPFSVGGMDHDGNFARSSQIERIKDLITRHDIKLFIADPLVEFHTAPENNNDLMKSVGGIFREIATDCDCSVLLFHHTPKAAGSDNSAGDANSLRGGGSLTGQARFVYTMFAMSKQDAKDYGVTAEDRPSYVRWDWAKSNMAPGHGEAQWWRKVGVSLDNADELRPSDHVGVLRPVSLALVDTGFDGKTVTERTKEDQEFARKVVAALIRHGHVTEETACPRSDLVGKIDRDAMKMSRETVKEKLTRVVIDGAKIDGYEVRILEIGRGSQPVKKYFVYGA
jgi:AAA domain